MGNPTDVPKPPFPVELIADLHADNLPPDVAAQLWPLVRRDADAMRVLQALDRVQGSLRDLGRDATIGASMPADVEERLNRALAAPPEYSPGPTIADVHEFRSRRRRRVIAASAAASAAAAVALVFAVATWQQTDPSPGASAMPTEDADPMHALDLPRDLPASTLRSVIGRMDAPGPLADVNTLAGCLTANAVSPSAPVLGSAPVRFDDADAVLLLVPGNEPGQVLALVVGTGCSASDPQTLARTEIGGR